MFLTVLMLINGYITIAPSLDLLEQASLELPRKWIGDKQVNVCFGFMYSWTSFPYFIFKTSFTFWILMALRSNTGRLGSQSTDLTTLSHSNCWLWLCHSTPTVLQPKTKLTESLSYIKSYFWKWVSRMESDSEFCFTGVLKIFFNPFCIFSDSVEFSLIDATMASII